MNQTLKTVIDSHAAKSNDPHYGWFLEGLNYPKLKYADEMFDGIMDVSLLSRESLHFIEKMVHATNHLDGCCVEFGTYKGASASVISNATERKLYCFDSFEGLTNKSDLDDLPEGKFADTNLTLAKSVAPSAEMIVGRLPGTFGEFLETHEERITFAHIDLDYFVVTHEVLEPLLSRMSSGAGVIIIDDYGNALTKGVRIAVDELCYEYNLVVTPLQTGQAFIILN